MLGVGVEFVERVVGRVSDGIDIVECKEYHGLQYKTVIVF